jgi:hypothetical protein
VGARPTHSAAPFGEVTQRSVASVPLIEKPLGLRARTAVSCVCPFFAPLFCLPGSLRTSPHGSAVVNLRSEDCFSCFKFANPNASLLPDKLHEGNLRMQVVEAPVARVDLLACEWRSDVHLPREQSSRGTQQGQQGNHCVACLTGWDFWESGLRKH